MTIADRLKAKLNKGAKETGTKANPITPKAMFEELDKPGTVTAFIDAALNGEDKTPLVILASHVNRSECLKAAHAAIKFSDLAAKHAPTYGLTAPEFTRLLAKLIIQDYNPAALEAEPEANATLTQTTPPAPAPAPAAPKQEPTANIFGIQDPTTPPANTKKGKAKA